MPSLALRRHSTTPNIQDSITKSLVRANSSSLSQLPSPSSSSRRMSMPSRRRSSIISEEDHNEEFPKVTCSNSYKAFKRCSANSHGIQENCAMAVKSYMLCAMNGKC